MQDIGTLKKIFAEILAYRTNVLIIARMHLNII